MENKLFINEYTRNEETAKEIYGFWFFKRPLMRVLFWYFAVCAVLGVANVIFNPFWSIESLLFVLYLAIYCGLMYFCYRSQVKTMVKRDVEMSGGRDLICTTTVCDDGISVESLDSKQTYSWEIIKFAFITKSYIILVTKARLMFIFKKDSFTLGDADGFLAYLKNRGIKVKGKN